MKFELMTFTEKKEWQERAEVATQKFWEIVDPNNESAIRSKDEFVQALRELCNCQANYTAACTRAEDYEQEKDIDENLRLFYDEDVLTTKVDYYEAFCGFVEKFYAPSQKKGGQSKSDKKAAASRENGKKGGRPRKEAD